MEKKSGSAALTAADHFLQRSQGQDKRSEMALQSHWCDRRPSYVLHRASARCLEVVDNDTVWHTRLSQMINMWAVSRERAVHTLTETNQARLKDGWVMDVL